MTFTIATTVDEAVAAMAAGARPIAGGSDLVVGARHGKAPWPEALVAIDRIPELAAIEVDGDGVRIGAGVTHARLMDDPVVGQRLTALADAAALIGSPATRKVGTLGGNVMNASPAMDTGAPLVVLDASVVLRSPAGERRVPIDELWTGPGETSAGTDELCVALECPDPGAASGSAYVRLEYRRAMEIAVVGAAAAVGLDGSGAVGSLSVALTAVAPTIVAVDVDDLVGGPVDATLGERVGARAGEAATPISDVRAGDDYRRHMVGIMAARAVDAATRRAAGEAIAVPVNRAVGVGA